MGKAPIFVLLTLLILPIGADAEFYRYTDENGISRFTDNLQEVPPDQRPQIKKYKEVEDDLTPARREAKRRREAEEARKAQARWKKEQKNNAVEGIRIDSPEDFQRVKTDLEDEYEALMRKKTALEKERGTLQTAGKKRAYQAKVRELNEEIIRFEKRRRQFVKKAGQFNIRQK